jgi:hypothetical protein
MTWSAARASNRVLKASAASPSWRSPLPEEGARVRDSSASTGSARTGLAVCGLLIR